MTILSSNPRFATLFATVLVATSALAWAGCAADERPATDDADASVDGAAPSSPLGDAAPDGAPRADGAADASSDAASGSAEDAYRALAAHHGCVAESPKLAGPCESAALAFVTCAARDDRQCLCEADDRKMNCEGAYKPDEGPALCVAEYDALKACLAR